jgi:hypothetical protein
MNTTSMFCPRCATPNPIDGATCTSCQSALPRRADAPGRPAESAAGTGALATRPQGQAARIEELETQLIIEKSQVKSPTVAAILGFILPPIGAFYNGKMAFGLGFIVLEFIFDGLSVISGGIPRLIYSVVGSLLAHRWAKRKNAEALEKSLAQHKRQARIAG